MTAQDIAGDIKAGQGVADAILKSVENLDPGVAADAGEAAVIVDLTAQLAYLAVSAYSKASGVPIDEVSIASLKADDFPLNDPDQ